MQKANEDQACIGTVLGKLVALTLVVAPGPGDAGSPYSTRGWRLWREAVLLS